MEKTIIEKLQKTDIINEYVVNNMTLEELGKKYDVTHHIVREFLIMNNIPRRRAAKRESLRPIPPVGKTFGQ